MVRVKGVVEIVDIINKVVVLLRLLSWFCWEKSVIFFGKCLIIWNFLFKLEFYWYL